MTGPNLTRWEVMIRENCVLKKCCSTATTRKSRWNCLDYPYRTCSASPARIQLPLVVRLIDPLGPIRWYFDRPAAKMTAPSRTSARATASSTGIPTLPKRDSATSFGRRCRFTQTVLSEDLRDERRDLCFDRILSVSRRLRLG